MRKCVRTRSTVGVYVLQLQLNLEGQVRTVSIMAEGITTTFNNELARLKVSKQSTVWPGICMPCRCQALELLWVKSITSYRKLTVK